MRKDLSDIIFNLFLIPDMKTVLDTHVLIRSNNLISLCFIPWNSESPCQEEQLWYFRNFPEFYLFRNDKSVPKQDTSVSYGIFKSFRSITCYQTNFTSQVRMAYKNKHFSRSRHVTPSWRNYGIKRYSLELLSPHHQLVSAIRLIPSASSHVTDSMKQIPF